MAKRIILLFIFVMMLLPLVGATAKIGVPYNLAVSCDGLNCSSLNITIQNPDSTILVNNKPMTNNVAFANYSFIPLTFGAYKYFLFDNTNYSENSFEATSTGYALSTSNSIVYLIMFFVVFFVFGMVMFFISKLPEDNEKDPEGKLLSISYLKYFRSALWFVEWILFIGILYLSSNLAFAYLGEQLFAKTLFVLFRIALGVTPIILIVWIIWVFVKIFHDKQLQGLINRGFFSEHNR